MTINKIQNYDQAVEDIKTAILQSQYDAARSVNEKQRRTETAEEMMIDISMFKDNPQANHFWKKNGFIVIKEVDREGWAVLVAEKKL